jgi:hypothetical protein
MRITVIYPQLVCVERPLLLDRYVELSRNGRWVDAKTGFAVCPLTAAAIDRVIRRAPPANVAL